MDPTALGRYLRESRESKELSLEDAVHALRIRRDVLESFEQGNFNVADSPVRVRGMLRNYARFLGLEEDRVLQYYEAAHSKRHKRHFLAREPHIEPLLAPKKITDTPPAFPAVPMPEVKRGQWGGLLRNLAMVLVSIAALAVIGLVIVNMLDFGEEVAIVPSPTQGTVTITPTNTPSLTPAALLATNTPDRIALGLVSIQVIVEMEQRSWLRVRIDGEDIYTGILEPNTQQTYEGSNLIEILAANAAALNITYNGQEQASFGARGQQVELSFSPTGIESSLGEIGVTPTEMPTNPPVQTEEAEASAEDSAVASVQILVTPTSVNDGVITPTPLFPVSNSAGNPSDLSPSPEAVTNNALPSATIANAVVNTVPTATIPAPSTTPSPAAVLPIRATPADGTPTKQS